MGKNRNLEQSLALKPRQNQAWHSESQVPIHRTHPIRYFFEDKVTSDT